MELSSLERISECAWRIPPVDDMRVPVVIYASEQLARDMDEKVCEQAVNVATLPGIVQAAYVMPDAHWGYGFPIGGVAAFGAEEGGVVSAGGVGFDVSCGVRTLTTGLPASAVEEVKDVLASDLARSIPAGLGGEGKLTLDAAEMDEMLAGGAAWAVARGWGWPEDLERIEEGGRMAGADHGCVSGRAKQRQRGEMGTLGSGNHYLEVQEVAEIFDQGAAETFGLAQGEVVVTIHCGSRGLGHQSGTDFLREMALAAPGFGIRLPDRELACAPIRSEWGSVTWGLCAPRSTARSRTARSSPIWSARCSRAVCRERDWSCCSTSHTIHASSKSIRLMVASGISSSTGRERHAPSGRDIPQSPRRSESSGQPVLVGGSMGTESWVLAGVRSGESLSFSSACHGAGRAMSRHQALKHWTGRTVVEELAARGIIVRCPSMRGVAEEAPGAYKDVGPSSTPPSGRVWRARSPDYGRRSSSRADCGFRGPDAQVHPHVKAEP